MASGAGGPPTNSTMRPASADRRCDTFGSPRDERDLQESVRVRCLGRWRLDLSLFLVLVEGVVQPREAVTVEDDLGVCDPGGLGAPVDV